MGRKDSYFRIRNRAVAELKMGFWSPNSIDQTITLCVLSFTGSLAGTNMYPPTQL